MEHGVFLDLPHQNRSNLKIISWNINGARTKLEKSHVYNFLSFYDVISLNEVKTGLTISIPGYVCYKSKAATSEASHRGGTIVFVKNYLARQIYNIDTSMIDQVWLNIRCVPNVTFGFCYVPPSDSPYFTPLSFVNIHEKIIDCIGNIKFCIIGDLNARFGTSVRKFP